MCDITLLALLIMWNKENKQDFLLGEKKSNFPFFSSVCFLSSCFLMFLYHSFHRRFCYYHYVPPPWGGGGGGGGRGHIVFSADPVRVGLATCLHSISLLNGQILAKLTQIYHREGGKC